MGKPKEIKGTPIRKGVKFVRKAGAWCYYETFNTVNVPDVIIWFDSEDKAKKKLKEILIAN